LALARQRPSGQRGPSERAAGSRSWGEPDETRRFLWAADVIATLAHTGQRISELTMPCWDDIGVAKHAIPVSYRPDDRGTPWTGPRRTVNRQDRIMPVRSESLLFCRSCPGEKRSCMAWPARGKAQARHCQEHPGSRARHGPGGQSQVRRGFFILESLLPDPVTHSAPV
jgi:hypothetical protein